MFKITIPPLVDNTNYKVTKVEYQISTTPAFEDGDILVDVTKEENIYEYLSDLSFTNNEVYYVRVKFYFDDGTESKWSKAIVVTKDSEGVLINNVTIKTPELKANIDPNNCPLGNFKVITSDFKLILGNGKHKYTYWEIRDIFGNLVWSRHKDKVNLTSILIPDHILESNKSYIIQAKFVSDTGGHSNWGRMYVKTTEEDVTCGSDKYMNVIEELNYVIDIQLRQMTALIVCASMSGVECPIPDDLYEQVLGNTTNIVT